MYHTTHEARETVHHLEQVDKLQSKDIRKYSLQKSIAVSKIIFSFNSLPVTVSTPWGRILLTYPAKLPIRLLNVREH